VSPQKFARNGEAAFRPGVGWSVVMSSTDSRDKIRSLPVVPRFSIIRPEREQIIGGLAGSARLEEARPRAQIATLAHRPRLS
jgi:hypothetical protein